MLVLLRFNGNPPDDEDLAPMLDAALTALSAQVGFVRGWVARSPDNAEDWVLAVEWLDVGSMRRGLGSFDAKLALGPLQPYASPASAAFEVLTTVDRHGRSDHSSDLAPDADTAHPT